MVENSKGASANQTISESTSLVASKNTEGEASMLNPRGPRIEVADVDAGSSQRSDSKAKNENNGLGASDSTLAENPRRSRASSTSSRGSVKHSLKKVDFDEMNVNTEG